MTRPIDSGASLIRALLDEPSAPLGAAEEAVGAGLAAASGLEGQVPSSTLRGLEKMRGVYSDLQRRIEGVHTIDGDIKGHALTGLKGMVAGLALFEAGVQGGASGQAQKQLGEATTKLERAAHEMEAALS
jgi:hypothetical protein